jgi:hypothetical protein
LSVVDLSIDLDAHLDLVFLFTNGRGAMMLKERALRVGSSIARLLLFDPVIYLLYEFVNAPAVLVYQYMISNLLQTLYKYSEVVHEPVFRYDLCPLSEQMSVAPLEQWVLELVLLYIIKHVHYV